MTVGAAQDGGYAYSAVSTRRGFVNTQSPPLEKPGSADLFSKSAAFLFPRHKPQSYKTTLRYLACSLLSSPSAERISSRAL